MEETIQWGKLSKEQGELFKSLIILTRSKTIVEIGVAYGTTTKWLCEGAVVTGGKVRGFDIWESRDSSKDSYENEYGKYEGKIKMKGRFQQTGEIDRVMNYLKEEGFDNFTLTQIDSFSDAFSNMLKKMCPVIDFAFIDGDHSYNGIKNDFSIVYPLLSPTGIIAFHDTQRIDGCREFVLDLRTKYNDGTFDIVEFPFGNEDRRVGITVLVKRSFPVLGLKIDEICGSPSLPEDIIEKEKRWYKNQIGSVNDSHWRVK